MTQQIHKKKLKYLLDKIVVGLMFLFACKYKVLNLCFKLFFVQLSKNKVDTLT